MAAKPKAQATATKDEQYLISLKKKFALSQDLCEEARKEWQIDQDYYDGIQWTADEVAKLRARKQPALTFNHVKPAINGMIGLVEKGRTDPEALGRTPKDSDAAEVATESLNYVADANRLQQIKSQALKDLLIPGVCCAVVEVDEKRDPKITKGRPESFFHDPYSREPDFSDDRWRGLANWMDEDDALALPYVGDDEKKQAAIKSSVDAGAGLSVNETAEDRPKGGWSWADNKSRRLMVVQMWHRLRGVWRMSVFVSAGMLQDGECEYKDQDGKPFCNLIAQSAYVDRENRRYGAVRDMRGPQDAINKGRSKAVHLLNVRQTRAKPGVMDADEIRAEAAKPDGHFPYAAGDFELLQTHTQFAPAHLELLRDAKAEMQRQSPTPGIVGRNAQGQSGRAILAEQQAGMTEQAPLLASFDDWTLRIYRAMWACIKQFWDAPKYIRVTDDVNAPKYVLLNQPFPELDKQGNPVLGPDGQPKMKLIQPAQVDVDIIIDSQPDTASLQQEQFQQLVELNTAAAQEGLPDRIPFEAIVEASSLPRKRQVLDKMKEAAEARKNAPQQPGPAEQEQAKQQIVLQANQAKLQQETHAKEVQHGMDAQAHAASLAREDQADEAKAQRQALLNQQEHQHAMHMATHSHNLSQQAANSQAHRDGMKARQQAKAKAAQGEGGESAPQGELPLGDQEDDMNFNIQLAPEVQQALMESILKTKENAAQAQTQAAQQSAQAQAEVPQAMMAVANAMLEAAGAMKQAAIVQAAPKELRVINGVKTAVPVLGTMN